LKYIYQVLLIFIVFLFTACSSKQVVSINQIKSFSLNNNIIIASIPRTVKSPVSFGIGLGGGVGKNVGIGVGTSVHPNISNHEAVQLERSLALNNIFLENIIENEIKTQFKNDEYYKNKFVPFGAAYTMFIYVPKYSLEERFFSSKAQIQIEINLRIKNNNNQIVYDDSQKNVIYSKDYKYDEKEILTDANILKEVVRTAVQNSVTALISEMKRN
jgi:hypothetical protein